MATYAKQSVFSGLSNLLMRMAVGKSLGAQPMPFMAAGKAMTLSQCKMSAGRIYSSPIDVHPTGTAQRKIAAMSQAFKQFCANCRAIGEYDKVRSR